MARLWRFAYRQRCANDIETGTFDKYSGIIYEGSHFILGVILFDWDEEKARINLDKHGVSFDEATSVFDDPLFLTFADPKHSIQEQRFIIMGESAKGRLIVVSYTDREEITRLISARPVTRRERKAYESDL
jgi:uncharacterized protein